MEPGYIAAICGLVGAIIGAASTAVVTYITQRHETKRMLTANLVAAGFEQWKEYFATYKTGKAGGILYPPEIYIFNLAQFAALIEKAGSLSDADLAQEIRSYSAKVNLVSHEYEIENAARHTASDVCSGKSPVNQRGNF